MQTTQPTDTATATGTADERDNSAILGDFEQLWMEVLGVDTIEDDDDFFDLGGHSLSALRLSTLIREELDVLVLFVDIAEHPLYADLREFVRRAPEEPKEKVYQVFNRPDGEGDEAVSPESGH